MHVHIIAIVNLPTSSPSHACLPLNISVQHALVAATRVCVAEVVYRAHGCRQIPHTLFLDISLKQCCGISDSIQLAGFSMLLVRYCIITTADESALCATPHYATALTRLLPNCGPFHRSWDHPPQSRWYCTACDDTQ